MEEDDDGSYRSGTRTRVAGMVLASVFLAAPVLSVFFTIAGMNDSDRDWGPTFVGLGILGAIALLYLAIRRWLRASVTSSGWDDDVWH